MDGPDYRGQGPGLALGARAAEARPARQSEREVLHLDHAYRRGCREDARHRRRRVRVASTLARVNVGHLPTALNLAAAPVSKLTGKVPCPVSWQSGVRPQSISAPMAKVSLSRAGSISPR